MEENKDYRVHRSGDLSEGYKLQVEHAVSCENIDISPLIAQGAETIQAMRQDSIEGEKKAYDIVVAAAKQWEQQAATTQRLDRALAYLRTPEVKHTGNSWQPFSNNNDWMEISNRVYKMFCQIREETRYDREAGRSVPAAWYVTWDLYLNSPREGYSIHLAGQDKKRYTDKAAAVKYLDGRKKAYSHLFAEISPPVPKEHENCFTVNGVLLPGYRVEGREQEKAGHTTASISEGGISVSGKEEKPSVLGKLSAAREREKAAAEPKEPTKKKEDMRI